MANSLTFETFSYYGNLLLSRLKKRLVLASRVNTSFMGDAVNAGATVNVPFITFSGTARTRAKDAAVVLDDFSNGNTPVTFVEVYSAGRLDVQDLVFGNVNIMERAAEEVAGALVAGVDLLIAQLWNKIPNEVGETDATAAFNATDKLAHLSSAIKRLMDNNSPMEPLYGIVNTTEAHNLRILDLLTKVNEAGTDDTRRDGMLGTIYGVEMFQTQQIESAALSATAAWGTPLIDLTAGYAVGVSTIHVDGVGLGATILKGSTFSLGTGANLRRYVVTTTAVASTNDIDLIINPPLQVAVVDDQALTPVLHTTTTATSNNLIFHPSALGLAIRPLPNFVPGSGVYQRTVSDPDTGLSLQLSIESHAVGAAGVAGSSAIKVALLAGAAVLQPNSVVRIMGEA